MPGTSSRRARLTACRTYGPHRNYPHHYFAFSRRHRRPRAVVRRRAHHPSPLSGDARQGRRAVLVYADTGMSGLDLLAFGPHPDDLEIGLGGTLAKHAALGHSVGLCDLTRGEMSSNGTPEERVKEAEAARKVLGAAWRENLALPDRAIGNVARSHTPVVELIRRVRPRAIAVPYWQDRHPDHQAVGGAAPRRDVQRQAAGDMRRRASRGSPSGSAITSSTTRVLCRSSSTCPRTTTPSGGRWRVTPASSPAQPNLPKRV